MSQKSIELTEVGRDIPRKHITEEYIAPVVPKTASLKEESDSDSQKDVTNAPKTRKQQRLANIQFCTLCWTIFLAGWNDGSTGPLLPRIREFYRIGFTVASLLFVLSCVGAVAGSLTNVPLSAKLGFGKVLVLASLLNVVASCLQAPGLPFPVFVITHMLNGFGLAMQDAHSNGYVASIPNSEQRMGFLHAAYGAGALVAPLVSTQFAQMKHWSYYYLITLGIAISNSIMLAVVFRFKSHQQCLQDIGISLGPVQENQSSATFSQILKQKNVHLIAFFIWVYVGVEVTIGGWIVTFIIDQRGGGPSSGYVSAGFFGGLMVGRVALLWVNKKVGESRVIFIYAILAIALELVVWLVPSIVGDAVAVSLVGLLLGPVYPITMNVAGRVLPHWILTGAIGWIAGFGQAGSAVFPFMTGALSSRFGIKSLQPLMVAMIALMAIMWAIVPKRPIKAD